MSSKRPFNIEKVSTDTSGSTIPKMQEQQMMQMEQYITVMACATAELYEQMCNLGLALLGDASTIRERRQAKHLMLLAINTLRSQLDMLESTYNLSGSLETFREQIM